MRTEQPIFVGLVGFLFLASVSDGTADGLSERNPAKDSAEAKVLVDGCVSLTWTVLVEVTLITTVFVDVATEVLLPVVKLGVGEETQTPVEEHPWMLERPPDSQSIMGFMKHGRVRSKTMGKKAKSHRKNSWRTVGGLQTCADLFRSAHTSGSGFGVAAFVWLPPETESSISDKPVKYDKLRFICLASISANDA
jgi:hypothetical protein